MKRKINQLFLNQQNQKKTPGIWISPELEKIIYQMSQTQTRGTRRFSKPTFATIDHLDSSRDVEPEEPPTLDQRVKIAESQLHNLKLQLKEIRNIKNNVKINLQPMRITVQEELKDIHDEVLKGVERIRYDAQTENLDLQQHVLKSQNVFRNVNEENIELTQTINQVRSYMDRLEVDILGKNITLPDDDKDDKIVSLLV